MKTKFNTSLLLVSLFGIALGFFGMLYEGLIFLPKMLNYDYSRLLFWHDFYVTINPVIFYIPVVPIATLILIVLFIKAPSGTHTKRKIGLALVFQLLALALTFYLVTQINLKFYFAEPGKYTDLIAGKTKAANLVSIIRLIVAAIALRFTFSSYLSMKYNS